MFERIRILPILMFCCVLMLFMRVEDIFAASEQIKEEPKKEEVKKEDKKEEAKKEGKKDEAKKDEAPKEGAKSDGEKKDEAAAKDTNDEYKSSDPVLFNDSELDILQSLSERRAQLDERERQIEQKEGLLQITEQRIEQKLEELRALKGNIENARTEMEKMMKTADVKDNQRIQDLVKTYETMKPKDAARIFDLLEMPILLEVIGQMKGAKMAPILAAMDPAKAKAVTMELAKRKQMPNLAEAAAPQKAAPPAPPPAP